MDAWNDSSVQAKLIEATREAIALYNKNRDELDRKPEAKADGTIVTGTDTSIQSFLLEKVRGILPGVAVIAEEGEFDALNQDGRSLKELIDSE